MAATLSILKEPASAAFNLRMILRRAPSLAIILLSPLFFPNIEVFELGQGKTCARWRLFPAPCGNLGLDCWV